MIAGVVVCGNTGSAEAALGGSEAKVAALASTGVGMTVETVSSGTDCSRLTDSTGSSVNAVAAGNAISASCGLSAGSSSNGEVSSAPSNASLASCVGHVISSMLSGIAVAACGAIAAVTSVNSLIAETPTVSAGCGSIGMQALPVLCFVRESTPRMIQPLIQQAPPRDLALPSDRPSLVTASL